MKRNIKRTDKTKRKLRWADDAFSKKDIIQAIKNIFISMYSLCIIICLVVEPVGAIFMVVLAILIFFLYLPIKVIKECFDGKIEIFK